MAGISRTDEMAGISRTDRSVGSSCRLEWRLFLLGAWQLVGADRPIEVGANGQRLFALLALRGRCDRSYLSGVLWPECSEPHAHGNLRATLSRLHRRNLSDPLESGNGALMLRAEPTPPAGVPAHRQERSSRPQTFPGGGAMRRHGT
jgi:hypothetical protein